MVVIAERGILVAVVQGEVIVVMVGDTIPTRPRVMEGRCHIMSIVRISAISHRILRST